MKVKNPSPAAGGNFGGTVMSEHAHDSDGQARMPGC